MKAAYDDETYRDLFGFETGTERRLADQLVAALEKIDPVLVPRASKHPHAGEISTGTAALDVLLDVVERDPARRMPALDAVAHVVTAALARSDVAAPSTAAATGAPSVDDERHLEAARNRLRALLAKERDPPLVAAILKVLAIARDDALVREQIVHLGDDDPGMVATAARLLGFSRDARAVPILARLVSPARVFESLAVIWALGEIADPRAVPALHAALERGFRVEAAAIAAGQIGLVGSVGHITPLVLAGTTAERDAGYRALAMLLDKNRVTAQSVGDLRAQLSGLIETQLRRGDVELTRSTRFFMALCLARLGNKLEPPRLRALLGLELDEEVSSVASYFVRRGKTK